MRTETTVELSGAGADVVTFAVQAENLGLDICEGAEVAFAADEDELTGMVADRKKELAFSLGGIGSSSTNFYSQAYSRQGWADVAAGVRV
jgi:hypothetical protein